MNICAKKIRIEFNNSSEDYWEATSEGGIVFDEAMRMIAKAWEEQDAPKEPLIKNEEIRRMIRCLGYDKIAFRQLGVTWRAYDGNLAGGFELIIKSKPFDSCEDGTIYSVAELCGEEEAPEPIEPTFVDLDERIKEKEEE